MSRLSRRCSEHGPNCERHASMMCNLAASCPEVTRQHPEEYIDACAHDMWVVGYLLLRVLGNLAPWSFNATGSAQETRAIICDFHEVWEETRWQSCLHIVALDLLSLGCLLIFSTAAQGPLCLMNQECAGLVFVSWTHS
ncbi:TPA: hypothetical protein ACH3X1_003564 [Trebouxia sp. C0004]